MAFTTPRTWVTGEVVTAAQLNAHIRDFLFEGRAIHLGTFGGLITGTNTTTYQSTLESDNTSLHSGEKVIPHWRDMDGVGLKPQFRTWLRAQTGVSVTQTFAITCHGADEDESLDWRTKDTVFTSTTC